MCSAPSSGVATYSIPRNGSSRCRGIAALMKHHRPVAISGGRDHPERHPLLADVLAQLIEVHQPCQASAAAVRGAGSTGRACC